MVRESTLPPGIEVRGDRIRICFSWEGQRYREPYPFPASPENIKRAGRLQGEIKQRIKMGVFTLEDLRTYFPGSARIGAGPSTLFGIIAQDWLDSVQVSQNTRDEYVKSLNRYWIPALASRPINAIRYSELRTLVNNIEWSSAKTRNNNLIPLRGVFAMAYADELIDRNPADRLKNQIHQKEPPDPFSREEADTIIAHLYTADGWDKIHAAYFEFAFYSGMRTSEMLALTWDDVDFRKGYVRVAKARSKGRMNDRTKTAVVRDVLLNDRSRHALQVAKELTFLAGGAVFRSGRYHAQEEYKTEKAQRAVFTRALKKLGMRHRKAYNTRHTYATMLLMAGANPAFVASQLGHSVTMTLTVYSKWIQGEADQRELDKLDLTPIAPFLPQGACEGQ